MNSTHLAPGYRGITAERGPAESAHDFTDFARDARGSLARLLSRPVGQRMVDELEARVPHIGPAVSVRSGHANTYVPVTTGATQQQQAMSVRPAYRYDGQPGAGRAGRVAYNPAEPSGTRFIGLGHELVHAHRAAHGLAVSPLRVSPQHAAPVVHLPTDPGRLVEQAIEHRALLREEFETVGLTPTPQPVWTHAGLAQAPPTENALRQEHGLPARPNYSGSVPGSDNAIIHNVDSATDDRYLPWHYLRRSPVRSILRHLGADDG